MLSIQLLDALADVIPDEVQDLPVIERNLAETFSDLPGIEGVGASVLMVRIDDIDDGITDDECNDGPCYITSGCRSIWECLNSAWTTVPLPGLDSMEKRPPVALAACESMAGRARCAVLSWW